MGRADHFAPAVEVAPLVPTLGPVIVRVPGVPPLEDAHREEVREAIGSLHSFVDLFERIRTLRLWRLALLAGLNLADCATTVWFLQLGGAEGNPLLAPIVNRWWAPLLIKTIIFLVVASAVMRSHTRARTTDRLLLAAVGYYVAVVAWNLWIIYNL